MKVIIMAGGSGTRLWPLSRTQYPKQFLKLNGMERSIFQLTLMRCLLLAALEDIYIVTNKDYKFLITGQVEEMGYNMPAENVLLEPQAKNTLPAIYNGVKVIREKGEDKVAVFPSDHLIGDPMEFMKLVKSTLSLADNYLLTFGVCPTMPETGYGYIKPGAALENGFLADEFKEKPDLATAEKYIRDGYLWNSGMFLFRTDIFVEEVKEHSRGVYEAFTSNDVVACFEQSPGISIDYGVMEKSKRVAVVPFPIKWSDLGSFSTFYDEYDSFKDAHGNVLFNDEIMIDSSDNMIYCEGDKAVAVIGVDNLVVVDQKDALLICHKDHSQRVKEVVNKLKVQGDPRADLHLTEYRPWGSFTILEEGQFYKIKRLTVLREKKLSYQIHYHRSEHWIVVSGTARVVRDGEEKLVHSGESIFVAAGQKHSLENPGKVLLEVIEVQSGAYLGEDDIVRFQDDFGRH
ncbi:MAG: mannose-1-phosphate guanylyltransferase/mannose-6-phosphate isomerase [Acidobacteriota bacterium]